MSGSITMAQIARELGISQVTVSAVVNGREKQQRISAKTASRVREYLDQRGYVQSKSAMQVKQGTSADTVGILYCGDFVQYDHLEKALSLLTNHIEKKYGIVEISGISPDMIQHGVREQVAKGVKRLIWIHANSPKTESLNAEKLFPLLNRMEHVIIYNYDPHKNDWTEKYLKRGIDLVSFDRIESYRRTAEMFRRQGHTKIALNEVIFGQQKGLGGSETLKDIFEECGFEIFGLFNEDELALSDEQHTRTAADNLIKLYKKDNVRCAFIRNDLFAAEVMHYLTQEGIKVPEDVAVIGFGDTRFSRLLPVPLTTFRHPVAEMCAKTIELLEEKSSTTGKHYFLKNEFIVRNSHGK